MVLIDYILRTLIEYFQNGIMIMLRLLEPNLDMIFIKIHSTYILDKSQNVKSRYFGSHLMIIVSIFFSFLASVEETYLVQRIIGFAAATKTSRITR